MCPYADPRNNQPSHAGIVHERVSQIAELLQEWGWSFPDLVRYWIPHNDGARGKRGHQKRVNILRSLLTDSDATVKAMKDDSLRMDSIDIATTLLVQEIRVEFGELRQRHIFGQWSAEEAKDISLLKVGKELSENAPIFRNFMVKLASNTRGAGGEYHREEEEGYLRCWRRYYCLRPLEIRPTALPACWASTFMHLG